MIIGNGLDGFLRIDIIYQMPALITVHGLLYTEPGFQQPKA